MSSNLYLVIVIPPGRGYPSCDQRPRKRPTAGSERYFCFLVLLSVIIALTACASPSSGNGFRSSPTTESVLLTVQNDNYWDATIHANWGGVRERLGFVVGKTTETFTFTWRRDEMQVEVRFTGDGGWRTDSILVSPGDCLELQIVPGPTGRRAPGV